MGSNIHKLLVMCSCANMEYRVLKLLDHFNH